MPQEPVSTSCGVASWCVARQGTVVGVPQAGVDGGDEGGLVVVDVLVTCCGLEEGVLVGDDEV